MHSADPFQHGFQVEDQGKRFLRAVIVQATYRQTKQFYMESIMPFD